jgi:hypothetical protein
VSAQVELPLADCGCCEGAHALTPAVLDNPAGASTLRYRVGTQAAFLATMRAGAAASPALAGLRARPLDDPAAALLDAWACTLDVLAFYSERIANEGFLRTATETGSLVDLAVLVGYQRAPGRAASAWLAFTLEDTVGAPPLVPIPTGTKVASLPGPGELPQTFETLAELDARPEWNALRARAGVPAPPVAGATRLHLAGTVTELRPGDTLLVAGRERAASSSSDRWALRTVRAVVPLPEAGVTRVEWDEPLAGHLPDAADARVHVLRQRAALFGNNAPDWRNLPEDIQKHYYDTGIFIGAATELAAAAQPGGGIVAEQPGHGIIFPPAVPTDWPGFDQVGGGATLELDAVYPRIGAGGWLALVAPTRTELFQVVAAVADAGADFGLTSKTTLVTLDHTVPTTFNGTRRTSVVLADSQQLELADAPLTEPVQGDAIELAAPAPALPPGRALLVSGRRPLLRVAEEVWGLALALPGGGSVALHPGDSLTVTGPSTDHADGTHTWPVQLGEQAGTVLVADGEVEFPPAPATAEVVTELAAVGEPAAAGPTVTSIALAARLAGAYDRGSLVVAANVAAASHGETRTEVLGSGDATVAFQRFRLAQSPLTYVAAAGPGGVASTLQVVVDGVRWSELPTLDGAAPGDRVYVVRIDGDSRVTVTFGDGVTGARLPTGDANVSATYRVGTGLPGMLPAGRLTLPMTRPLGLRSVTNPLPTGLAADPDALELLRRNAPNAALALDRVVSLTDYADFARATAGIAKASATWRLVDQVQVIELVVAGDAGQTVDQDARDALQAALAAAGDPHQRVVISDAEQVGFGLSATLFTEPDRPPGTVRAAATTALLAAFGFEARDLGQAVTASEVMAAAQAVPGVVAVTLNDLETTISAGPGQLLTLDPGGLTLVEVSA